MPHRLGLVPRYMSATIQIMRLGEAARTAPITESQIDRLESELTGIFNRYKAGRQGGSNYTRLVLARQSDDVSG